MDFLEFAELSSSDPSDIIDELAEKGWGDGLPVVPPTEERVEAFLAEATQANPDETIAVLEPRLGEATRKVIAINAVMAGCLPQHQRVLEAAVRAMARHEFNLRGVNATTHPVAPLLIVHGEEGFNSGLGAFGPGNRHNAAVGRAVRFLLMHVAGAIPGAAPVATAPGAAPQAAAPRATQDTQGGDASTQGQPSKYSYCVAENIQASPWESYPRSIGVATPAVTLHAGENPHNFHDMESDSPEPILEKGASVMATLGCNNAPIGQGEFFVGLCPEHAQTIASAGWSRQDVQQFLYERARRPMSELKRHFALRAWQPWQEAIPDDAPAPMTDSPQNIKVFVVGGAGKHSCVIPSWGMTKSVTLAI